MGSSHDEPDQPLGARPRQEGSGSGERRRVERHSVLLAARLDIGGSVLDCVVLDASTRGVRLQFGAPVVLPDHVKLMMRDGSTHEARRCWSRGTQVGLQFLGAGSQRINDMVARRAKGMLERVQATDPEAWLPALRAERFFGDAEVREAAEAVEQAHRRLLAALRGRADAGT